MNRLLAFVKARQKQQHAPDGEEDITLLLGGKKLNFNKAYFDRFGAVLGLNDKQINAVYKRLVKCLPRATQHIDRSLGKKPRITYKELASGREKRLAE